MAGTALVNFASFAEATGPLYLEGPRGVVVDAQKRTSSVGAIMAGDRGKKRMLAGGEEIRCSLKLNVTRRSRWHLPGDTHSWKNPQNLKKARYKFRYLISHFSWTKQEVLQNSGGGDQFDQYVDLLWDKEGEMWVDKWNLLEESAWATPVASDMENEDGVQMMSVPAYVNGFTSGLFEDLDSGETFTTVGQIDPTATGYSKWVPQTFQYSSTDVNADNIISNFDLMRKKLHFESPPTHNEYYTNPAYQKFCIFTSLEGSTAYEQLLREHTTEGFHNVAGPQDPAFNNPMYRGIPVKWVDQLSEATLYQASDDSAMVTEGAALATTHADPGSGGTSGIGPRFWFLNTEFLYLVFHENMYFEKDEVSRAHEDPDTFVMPVETWMQMPCSSRYRQGFLEPTGDMSAGLY
jgi:hypothetical protein